VTRVNEQLDSAEQEASYLLTPRAIRDRAEELYSLCQDGKLEHFTLDEARLERVADRVVQVTRNAYPDIRKIPYHARWRHFGVGGKDRIASFDQRVRAREERLLSKFELVITSVLLDAGAGESWRYRDADGEAYARSEGLAVASYDLFVSGALSADPANAPLRADARVLAELSAEDLAHAFQADERNPLVGLEGRAAVLRTLGKAVASERQYFGAEPRLGELGIYLASIAEDGAVRAGVVLESVLAALGAIWPGREVVAGRNLGDVWMHPSVGRVPFHKLSQWLAYSLCEPLEEYGVRVTALEDLTGLAEYRNGGLFVDDGVLVPKHPSVLSDIHKVSSSVVVEWRALTVALLDRTAAKVRSSLGLSQTELPLAKVLEGGTWAAGRQAARERRPSGAPPIRVASDGTVF
jgi:hypothetical protein